MIQLPKKTKQKKEPKEKSRPKIYSIILKNKFFLIMLVLILFVSMVSFLSEKPKQKQGDYMEMKIESQPKKEGNYNDGINDKHTDYKYPEFNTNDSAIALSKIIESHFGFWIIPMFIVGVIGMLTILRGLSRNR